MPIDTRREMNRMWREFGRFHRVIGERLIWFKFDTTGSAFHPVYDEGNKQYLKGIKVPILWVDQVEDTEQYTDSGRRPTQRLKFAVSSRSLGECGISTREAHGNRRWDKHPILADGSPAPWLDDRNNDIVYYDGRFYGVSNFQIRGRAKGQDVIIGVSGIELDPDDEFIWDKFPGRG